MADKVGPQGWWIDEHQAGAPTIAAELAKLENMQTVAPSLMQSRPGKSQIAETVRKVMDLQAADGITAGVDLRYLEKLAFGEFFDWKAQLIGSCVASGGMRAIASRTLAELLIHGQLEETHGDDITGRDNLATFAPYSYRAGRKIGGLNGGDGSFCGAHIDGLRRYGTLRCDTPSLESDTFPEPQNTSAYRRWGNSNSLLEQFTTSGQKWKLLESTRLQSADDFKAACVDQWKPAMICSMWAFVPDHRHDSWQSDGDPVYIYRRRGQWAHNMTLCGAVEVADTWYAIVRNSWGSNAHSGRDWFPISFDLLDTWLRDRGTVSMTIGELDLPDSPSIEV